MARDSETPGLVWVLGLDYGASQACARQCPCGDWDLFAHRIQLPIIMGDSDNLNYKLNMPMSDAPFDTCDPTAPDKHHGGSAGVLSGCMCRWRFDQADHSPQASKG